MLIDVCLGLLRTEMCVFMVYSKNYNVGELYQFWYQPYL